MKILCFIDSLRSGGAQRQLVELAKGFKERGHEVSFLTYHELNFFKPDLDQVEIPVTTIVEPNYWKRALKIRRFIRRSQPDAVLAFLEASAFMATVAGFPWRKWKLVVGERSANPNILKSPKLRFYRFFHLFTDYVVANSHANMELVKKANPLLPKSKQKILYNLTNSPSINHDSVKALDDKTRIVIAASYLPVKNFDGLVKAVNLLPEVYKNKLIIDWYGTKDETVYATKIENLITRFKLSHIIHLHSAVQNILDKYKGADFVALVSHHEGFPNTICEAMAMGKPVIVTAVSDIPLFIKENENGFMCSSDDYTSIGKALMKAIDTSENERIDIGMRNKKLAEELFDPYRIINEMIDLFD